MNLATLFEKLQEHEINNDWLEKHEGNEYKVRSLAYNTKEKYYDEEDYNDEKSPYDSEEYDEDI